MSRRIACVAGMAGPIGFLTAAFLLSTLRHDVIVAQGWKSWPSSMALGGTPGIPMICAFLWLAACYSAFSLGALRPELGAPAAWIGLLAVAAGDVLLTTLATLVAAAGVTVATLRRPGWHVWRLTLPVPFLAAAIGAAAGFDSGWAKVIYVVGITLPAAVVGRLLLREVAEAGAG